MLYQLSYEHILRASNQKGYPFKVLFNGSLYLNFVIFFNLKQG